MEDYFLSLRIAERYRVKAINEELCVYRVHGANASLDIAANESFEDLRIVRHFYPNPKAFSATLRIIARYLMKCSRSRTVPKINRLASAMRR
jgi:hypothetical protein